MINEQMPERHIVNDLFLKSVSNYKNRNTLVVKYRNLC